MSRHVRSGPSPARRLSRRPSSSCCSDSRVTYFVGHFTVRTKIPPVTSNGSAGPTRGKASTASTLASQQTMPYGPAARISSTTSSTFVCEAPAQSVAAAVLGTPCTNQAHSTPSARSRQVERPPPAPPPPDRPPPLWTPTAAQTAPWSNRRARNLYPAPGVPRCPPHPPPATQPPTCHSVGGEDQLSPSLGLARDLDMMVVAHARAHPCHWPHAQPIDDLAQLVRRPRDAVCVFVGARLRCRTVKARSR
jgi:hypothetical protein